MTKVMAMAFGEDDGKAMAGAGAGQNGEQQRELGPHMLEGNTIMISESKPAGLYTREPYRINPETKSKV